MILVVTTNGIFVVDTSLYILLYTFQQITELLILLKTVLQYMFQSFYWIDITTETTGPTITKISADWKKEHDKNNPNAASAEASRRYYSVKTFLKSGVHKVYSPILPPKEDEKFFDQVNKRSLYSKQHLQKSIEKFVKFPIATNFDKGKPRLLVVVY